MNKSNTILLAIVAFACLSLIQAKNVGQLEIIKQFCSEQLKTCTNNKACSENDINVVECLEQCNSFYASQIVTCHNQKVTKTLQLDIIQKYCSSQVNACIQDKVCFRLLDSCKSREDITVVECLQQSNSLYANKITQCHDDNSNN